MADPTNAASIALNRFGLGARGDDARIADPRRWLTDQLARYTPRPAAIVAAPGTAQIGPDLVEYTHERQARRQAEQMGTAAAMPASGMAPANSAPMKAGAPADAAARNLAAALADPLRGRQQQYYGQLVAARCNQSLATDTPFVERLVQFWANHFAVSAEGVTVVGMAGTLENEAIRPHVLGRFADLLSAVEHHPAMLFYLNQNVSIGPDSALGQRAAAMGGRRRGLNENLGREVLELHTLGVRTGYTQADVTEFARALTGWTVAGFGGRFTADAGPPGTFVYADALHEPGARTIMGKRYDQPGEAQAQAILADLAVHPATAGHLATKLARHFAGDAPPPAMVARLQAAYLHSGGDLPTVYRAIVASPEAWTAAPVKFRNPWEWSIASLRALGLHEVQPPVIVGLMNQLGQPVWKPGQPVGYDDTAPSWAGPDALMRRVEAAERFAARAGETIDARALAPRLFPASVSAATAEALQRAESPGQALALLLVSPEMMRR